jgi:hypothetical protein
MQAGHDKKATTDATSTKITRGTKITKGLRVLRAFFVFFVTVAEGTTNPPKRSLEKRRLVADCH